MELLSTFIPKKDMNSGAVSAKNGGKTAVEITNEYAELAQSKKAQPLIVRLSFFCMLTTGIILQINQIKEL